MKSMGNPYSNLKVFRHKDYLDAIEQGDWKPPIYIRLKPTNLCNHHCAYCTYGSGGTQQKTENRDIIDHRSMIPWEKIQEIIADMIEMGVKAVTFSGGGEPLTYPRIVDAAGRLAAGGIDISLISNGELLDGKVAEAFYHAKWIRISFDSPNEEEYCALRRVKPGSFQRVVSNIKNFAINKSKDCVLGVNFVISKANYNRVYEAAALLKDLGVDNVKFAAVIDNSRNYHREIKDQVIAQIRSAVVNLSDESFRIINNYENDWMDKKFSGVSTPRCYTCRLVTVIAADQKVYLCHTQAYDSNAIVGDISNKRFKDFWFSNEAKTRIISLNPQTDCRSNCAYEMRNEAIQGYLNSNVHVNFI